MPDEVRSFNDGIGSTAESRQAGRRSDVHTVDVVLLKMPNHNMDYPHLAVPTLTSALRRNFFKVKQQDVNVLLRDHLLTKEMLDDLAYRFLPELAKAHVDVPADFDRIRNALVYLHYIDDNIGFARIEAVKKKLQSRQYESVFCDEQESGIATLIFVLTGMLHVVIDLALTHAETGGEIPNPVTDFLHAKVLEVAALNPRIVGFSVIQIQRKATLWFARHLRPLIVGKIVVGGPDVSTFKEEYLKNNDYIDYGFLKEAETTMLDFLRGQKKVEEIDGVVYRDEEGNIKVNEARYDISLSVFRPDFDDYDLDKFLLPTLPLSTSRGCAFAKCTFCNHYKTYSGYYSNDAKTTVDNIEYLVKRYNTRFFHFVDDMLEVHEGKAIAEELIKRDLDVNILTYARFEPQFLEPGIIELWHKAGIRVVEWGLESASQKVLKKMIKGVSIRQVQEI
ncbi:B12-binding domain-containing radical SAM protein, partial [Arenibaculum sp.]|uniref:B12-binding domain-containing radical SAM protein n=1 Tax=Arenibaculum sp. TaxID=2865862 RepID=UPI002E0D74F0|nr:radical SAM protein [Arenibaculum sp.]